MKKNRRFVSISTNTVFTLHIGNTIRHLSLVIVPVIGVEGFQVSQNIENARTAKNEIDITRLSYSTCKIWFLHTMPTKKKRISKFFSKTVINDELNQAFR